MKRLLIMLGVAALLAACGSSDESPDATDATDSIGVDSAPVEPTSDAPVPDPASEAPTETQGDAADAPVETADLSGFDAGPPVDACALLTDVEVQALVGAIVPGAAENVEPLFFGCRWETDLATVSIDVISHGDAEAARASFDMFLGDNEKIEGVGDAALSNVLTDIAFISGAYEVTIYLGADLDEAAKAQRVREIALTIIPRLQ